jgi:hypothetical protein
VTGRRTTSGRSGKSSSGLPDVARWQPREDSSADLAVSYRRRCQFVERRLLVRAAEEQAANIDNFDSGLGIEEIFRDELAKLLPARYGVTTGVISDRNGATAGHCDCVIFNDFWFPATKAGATEQSRRRHLPIEGTYGVIEVKQSLDARALDSAMEKLVVCQRLHRPLVARDRIVENRESGSCLHAISNPMHTAIFALGLGKRADFQSLVERFININKMLKRREIVTCLVVLGHGQLTWAYESDDGIKPARFFYEDLYAPLRPAWTPAEQEGDTFYHYAMHLNGHLYSSVLGAEDIAALYGEHEPTEVPVKLADDRWVIPEDHELIESLQKPCDVRDRGFADLAWEPPD